MAPTEPTRYFLHKPQQVVAVVDLAPDLPRIMVVAVVVLLMILDSRLLELAQQLKVSMVEQMFVIIHPIQPVAAVEQEP
jgi:hypothetical protein